MQPILGIAGRQHGNKPGEEVTLNTLLYSHFLLPLFQQGLEDPNRINSLTCRKYLQKMALSWSPSSILVVLCADFPDCVPYLGNLHHSFCLPAALLLSSDLQRCMFPNVFPPCLQSWHSRSNCWSHLCRVSHQWECPPLPQDPFWQRTGKKAVHSLPVLSIRHLRQLLDGWHQYISQGVFNSWNIAIFLIC